MIIGWDIWGRSYPMSVYMYISFQVDNIAICECQVEANSHFRYILLYESNWQAVEESVVSVGRFDDFVLEIDLYINRLPLSSHEYSFLISTSCFNNKPFQKWSLIFHRDIFHQNPVVLFENIHLCLSQFPNWQMRLCTRTICKYLRPLQEFLLYFLTTSMSLTMWIIMYEMYNSCFFAPELSIIFVCQCCLII